MALGIKTIKTEMNGTGGGRWQTRESAKKASKKSRRASDKKAARDQG
jgi:hypothetical protein